MKGGPAEQVSLLPLGPISDHAREALGAGAFTPARPVGTVRYLLVQALVQNIRYTIAATSVPTATVGFQLVLSDPVVLIPIGPDVTPKFFREAAGAILQYQWCE
jgi:hypothetical protein